MAEEINGRGKKERRHERRIRRGKSPTDSFEGKTRAEKAWNPEDQEP